MAKIWDTDNANADKDVERGKLSLTAGGSALQHTHFGRELGRFLYKTKYSGHRIQHLCSLVFSKRVENLGPHKNLYTDVSSIIVNDTQLWSI